MFRKLVPSVPQRKTNLTYLTVLFVLFALLCSARGFYMSEVFRDNFWAQKCSQIGKRLGTTALGEHEKLTGGTPKFKNHTKQVFFVEFLIWGVQKGDTILIWGYAEE